jgi:hypothetical protein
MATQQPFSNPEEAMRLALKACELTDFKNPFFLDTLSSAYASAGKFSEAVETAQSALNIAQSAGKKQLYEEIQKHIELYKNNKHQ